jgi:hypothetical protein
VHCGPYILIGYRSPKEEGESQSGKDLPEQDDPDWPEDEFSITEIEGDIRDVPDRAVIVRKFDP